MNSTLGLHQALLLTSFLVDGSLAMGTIQGRQGIDEVKEEQTESRSCTLVNGSWLFLVWLVK